MILKRIPTEQDLYRLYWELSRLGASSVGKKINWPYKPVSREALVILACDMLRYDPRLLSILILYFIAHWKDLNPIRLRELMPEMRCPQVLGVLKEFIFLYSKDSEIKFFFEYLTKGLRPVEPQLFFIGVFPIGGAESALVSKKNLRQYSQWGFLSMEKPVIDLATKKMIGTYSFQSRQKLIQDLVERRKKVSLKEYLRVVDYTISRQQAFYDLKHCKVVKLKGHGRGAKWVVKTD